jgi:hypothetical protein
MLADPERLEAAFLKPTGEDVRTGSSGVFIDENPRSTATSTLDGCVE